ncbi:MAG: hypothetical protein ACTSYS_13925 [Promethearchaeota archaeon]
MNFEKMKVAIGVYLKKNMDEKVNAMLNDLQELKETMKDFGITAATDIMREYEMHDTIFDDEDYGYRWGYEFDLDSLENENLKTWIRKIVHEITINPVKSVQELDRAIYFIKTVYSKLKEFGNPFTQVRVFLHKLDFHMILKTDLYTDLISDGFKTTFDAGYFSFLVQDPPLDRLKQLFEKVLKAMGVDEKTRKLEELIISIQENMTELDLLTEKGHFSGKEKEKLIFELAGIDKKLIKLLGTNDKNV